MQPSNILHLKLICTLILISNYYTKHFPSDINLTLLLKEFYLEREIFAEHSCPTLGERANRTI